ncbi:MAG: type II toxin-antitoxin system HicA family toxin [Candidatus Vogelbacteria bacterium]|nr:type II toxin-antitoxin system HicA family toxin [Candidatus Vogelbacteria bacterium]
MTHLGSIRAREIIRVLHKLQFYSVRQKGSHLFFRHDDGRTTLVPVHPSEEISTGLLRQILGQIKISPEEFSKLRNE